MNVYFISGLGVDERVFQKLKLPQRFAVHFINWIKPLPQESISRYAERLSSFIDTAHPFVLIGMSFGGIIATEMNHFVHPQKTIIISSAATKNQLPPYFKLAGLLRLHKIVPVRFLKKPNPLFHWLFGIKTEEEKALFKNIIHDADPKVVQWSVNAVLNWKNIFIPKNLVHVHGTADVLLPARWAEADIKVKGGKHFMVYSKAGEVSAILAKILKGVE